MTEIEQRAMQALPAIRYARERWHEPRAKTLYRLFKSDPLWPLSEHEQDDLWFLIWTYRRQVNDPELIARADALVNGALCLSW